MDKNLIGEWAGIVWNTLSTENRKWTFEEVQRATGLSERELAGAVGWLARENKIQFEIIKENGSANISLMVNIYIG